MLNKALQSQLLLDTAGSGLLGGSQLHQSDESRMQHLALQMAGRDADKDHLLARLSDMELVLQQQQQVNVQAQQTITKLQAQIILLEERYRLTSNGGADLPQQDEGLALQQALSGRHGLEADLLAAAAAANSTSPGALRAAMSMPGASAFAAAAGSSAGGSVLETSSSGGSSSTTTTGPASSSVPSGSGDSSSSSAEGAATAPWQRGAGYSAFGLHPAPSAPSHLAAAADLPGGSLPVLQPSLDALVSPLPTSLSGLSRSLSLSATAAGAKQQQQQQHKPRQPGGSAGGALGADHNSSSEEFAQDAEVWPAPLASRSQSLLSTRDLGPPPAAADSAWRFSSSTGAAAPGGLAASLGSTNGGVTPPAVTGSGSGFPMRTPPQPIMGPHTAGRHGLHGAAAAAAASAAAAAAAAVSPWAAGPGMSPTVGAAGGPLAAGIPGSSSNLPFSPASWEHPLLVAGRQGSALGLDPLAAAGDSAAAAAAAAAATAEYHSLLAAAAAGLDIQAVAAAAAASASAANTGLHGMASDRFSHDSNLARLLPVDLKRLVTEGSLGSLSGSLQQAHSGLLGASHGSLDDLQQALVAQQLAAAVHQGQQQQHSAAAMAAAAAAAVAAAAMQQQGQLNAAAAAAAAAASNATVRGGKPLQPFGSGGGMGAAPVPLKGSSSSAGGGRIPIPTPNSRSGSLSSSRSNHALLRAASGPASSAFLDADDPAALFSALGSSNDLSVRGQSEVVFARGSGSLREAGLLSQAVEAEAREREKRVVRKWTDCWGPDSEAEQGPASPTAAAAAREAGGAYGSSSGGGMSRSLPAAAGSGGLAAAAMAELPDTADNDLPDQDSLLARINSSGGGGASFGGASLAASASSAGLGLGLRQPSGCSLTRSASALAASEMSQGGCRDEDGAGAGDLDAAAQNARLRSKQDACPNTCVYVGFLGWWVSEKDLVEYFSPYGELVSVRLLISKKSRRSREQAFVEYAEVEQAQKAITWLDSIDYPALVKQLGCGGLVVRFADRKKPAFE